MEFWLYFWSALGIGALHALEPGHGKSIMGAYLVMSRGRSSDAVLLGLTSAITHTLVIVVLAFMAHSAATMAVNSTDMSQDRMELWLKLISGAIIVLVGLRMLFRKSSACGCGCGHTHHQSVPAGPVKGKFFTSQLSSGRLSGSRFSTKNLSRPGGSLMDVLLLGFTNGLMPCPSALAILLLSVSSGALATGLALVFAFGIGGAIALVAVGLVFVKVSSMATGLFNNRAWDYLSKASGSLICAIGFVTVYSAWTMM